MNKQITKCPSCNGALRIPRNKGMLKVSCPLCKHSYKVDSNQITSADLGGIFGDFFSNNQNNAANQTKSPLGNVSTASKDAKKKEKAEKKAKRIKEKEEKKRRKANEKRPQKDPVEKKAHHTYHQNCPNSAQDPYIIKLSERMKTNGVIWLVIGILQIVTGVGIIAGILNIRSAIGDLKYSKTLLESPQNVVETFEPTFRPIVVLIYNLIFGLFIGIIGSVYYFVAIRGFVMKNRLAFQKYSR